MFHFFAVVVAVILDKNEECFKFVSHEYVGERVRESMLESLPPRYTLSLSPTGKQKNAFYDIQRFSLKPVFGEIHLFIIPFLFFIEK